VLCSGTLIALASCWAHSLGLAVGPATGAPTTPCPAKLPGIASRLSSAACAAGHRACPLPPFAGLPVQGPGGHPGAAGAGGLRGGALDAGAQAAHPQEAPRGAGARKQRQKRRRQRLHPHPSQRSTALPCCCRRTSNALPPLPPHILPGLAATLAPAFTAPPITPGAQSEEYGRLTANEDVEEHGAGHAGQRRTPAAAPAGGGHGHGDHFDFGEVRARPPGLAPWAGPLGWARLRPAPLLDCCRCGLNELAGAGKPQPPPPAPPLGPFLPTHPPARPPPPRCCRSWCTR
jgi:hypothetical protein